MWKLLRLFVCLLLVGSLSGIVARPFRILIRVEDYEAIKVIDNAQAQDDIAQKYRVQGGWFGFYGVQFFCLSLAKLVVRHRRSHANPLASHATTIPLRFIFHYRGLIPFPSLLSFAI
jgi:hypothetical protein